MKDKTIADLIEDCNGAGYSTSAGDQRFCRGHGDGKSSGGSWDFEGYGIGWGNCEGNKFFEGHSPEERLYYA